ncbi:MAG TPA: hypothetical protein VN605_03200 [Thermoanaerobaculia bacterium]|nr:hypothetical protein [Thermoanaerobaculia bacterium]
MVVIGAVFAIPLMHCATNTTPGTDTGLRARSFTEPGSARCTPNPDSNNPVICIDTAGVAVPDRVAMHSHDHGVGNPILWRTADGGGTLTLNLSCPGVVEQPICHGPICTSRATPITDGTCSYTAVVNGVGGSDPIIVTDNCCPAPGPGTEHHPGKH